jgi:hypothetical protein
VAQISEVYQLVFTREMYNHPILHELGKKFRLTVTIRRAVLNEGGGWAEVRLAGPEEEVGRAIADLQTTGVNSTGPIADLVEPDYDEPVPAVIGRGT